MNYKCPNCGSTHLIHHTKEDWDRECDGEEEVRSSIGESVLEGLSCCECEFSTFIDGDMEPWIIEETSLTG